MCIKFQLNKEEKYLLNTTNLKGVIDSLVDVFWAGGINNSYTIIEEISQLWIFRLIARKTTPRENSIRTILSIYLLKICGIT